MTPATQFNVKSIPTDILIHMLGPVSVLMVPEATLTNQEADSVRIHWFIFIYLLLLLFLYALPKSKAFQKMKTTPSRNSFYTSKVTSKRVLHQSANMQCSAEQTLFFVLILGIQHNILYHTNSAFSTVYASWI